MEPNEVRHSLTRLGVYGLDDGKYTYSLGHFVLKLVQIMRGAYEAKVFLRPMSRFIAIWSNPI